MEYIKIKNQGLIEVLALSLVGASTKVGDTDKIGQFGSGSKYALAYFLRNNFKVRIFSGKKEIEIETVPTEFRGNVFNVIHIDGQSTSITSEMGKDWAFWQAVREVYCNAIDEGGTGFDLCKRVSPKEDETQFYIEYKGDAIKFVEEFDSYFATNKKVVFSCSVGRILRRSGKYVNIYRKGIKCNQHSISSVFDYDLNSIDVGENRLASYSWQLEEKVWDLIFRCDDELALKQIFFGLDRSVFENGVSEYSDISSANMSEQCRKVIKSMKFVPESSAGLMKPDEVHNHNIVPTKVFNQLKADLENENMAQNFRSYVGGVYREIEPTREQEILIDSALSFLKTKNFHIPYLVKVAIFTNKEILGCADQDLIILSETSLVKGVTDIINTIIEEFIHIKYGVQDETRGFQTAIITEFIHFMKNNGGQ